MTKVGDEPERQLMVRENGIAAIRPLNTYGRSRPDPVVPYGQDDRLVSPKSVMQWGDGIQPAHDWIAVVFCNAPTALIAARLPNSATFANPAE